MLGARQERSAARQDHMIYHTITSVKPIAVGRLSLVFAATPTKTDEIDLSAMLAQGGVFEPLRHPAHFSAVEIGPSGRTLLWRIGKDEVDLCADALWLMAHPDAIAAV
jgi:hypothetical protein